jgi:diaminohydroxyphosphoribosylaminopyrimidine deaminase / 5-amino-6-(5-phosphoribosylamino)uracil reductase
MTPPGKIAAAPALTPSADYFMRAALSLARRGLGRTSPNPCVGAVIVKKGEIIGQGYHRRAGGPHAEILALEGAGKAARGANLYVTLEPCCHFGRTPPCVEAILQAGIKRVFVAATDLNPKVRGKGMAKLRAAGIAVHSGLLEAEANALNETYNKYIATGLPFVTLKLASSLDGKIATRTGESRGITGEAARRFVHRLRAGQDAILVGTETVLKDNPELTVRSGRGADPRRIILDTKGRIPLSAKVFAPSVPPPILVTTPLSKAAYRKALSAAGVEVLVLPAGAGRVDLTTLLTALAEREITSLLVEGGGKIAAGFLEAGLVDKVCFIFAPLIIGGENAPLAVAGEGIARLREAWRLSGVRYQRLGSDLAVIGYLPTKK